MESMGKKPRRRRSFTPEFKTEIVELCRQGDRSVGQVAKDFDLTEMAVREWVKQAERDSGARQDGGRTSSERKELAELRRENRRLREDVVLSSGPRLSSLRPTWRIHEPCTLTEAVAPAVTDGLDGSREAQILLRRVRGRTPHFHPHTDCRKRHSTLRKMAEKHMLTRHHPARLDISPRSACVYRW
jgi:transposase